VWPQLSACTCNRYYCFHLLLFLLIARHKRHRMATGLGEKIAGTQKLRFSLPF
jgi:hypothetical protein